MGQGHCVQTAAALVMAIWGLSPALAMDRIATDQVASDQIAVAGGSLGAPCPTRFDYLVLASLADAPRLLSLSTYHFRSESGSSTTPLAGLLRVDFAVESGAQDCRARDPRRQTD